MIKAALSEASFSSKPDFRKLLDQIETWKKEGYNSDPYEGYLEAYDTLKFEDIVEFYNKEIKNKPLIITIVGDVSRFNLKELKKYGEVIKVKKKKLFVH